MLLFTQLQSGIKSRRKIESDLKQAIGSKVPVRTKEKLHAAVDDHMLMLQNNPERVASYFQDPYVKYAA